MEALLDELLEGVPGQELGDEVPGFPDGVDDPDSGSNEQDDEGQHHIEAEVAKAAKRSLAYSLAVPAVTESGSRCLPDNTLSQRHQSPSGSSQQA